MSLVNAKIQVKGVVQGVGFRPFVHKMITRYSICGWVRNSSSGAEMELEGEESDIQCFLHELRDNPPSLARIESIKSKFSSDLTGFKKFEIKKSATYNQRNTLISPDVCICDDCRKELFDSSNRRFRYPFINCTNCGPRFTIIRDVPYDRPKTTMAEFPMCPECAGEFTDITDRRYHAQPDCCADCGPQIFFADKNGHAVAEKDEAMLVARKFLQQGKIIAVKGLGGFHLACLADNRDILAELRRRKQRDGRPFAIMCRDADAAAEYAFISVEEKEVLLSKERPIVLLRKKSGVTADLISENNFVGIMLPYTPLHYLLFDNSRDTADFNALVMTSANFSELPILYKNEEALSSLHGVADGFLMHNREIHVRCDDSLAWVYRGEPYFARRSRGFVPLPLYINISNENNRQVLACGAEQKATFGLFREERLFLSQHIGDLKNRETLENYENQISHFENLFDIQPQILVCDLHPDYLSTRYAESTSSALKIPLLRVQHHKAHFSSCMADNELHEPCLGIVWDGTGFGEDGTTWGAEFFAGGYADSERLGSILPIRLPGGDRCTKETWRTGLSLALESGAYKDYSQQLEMGAGVRSMLQSDFNCPRASSMGRLFDGVSALLGICDSSNYEGRGAILLETEAVRYLESAQISLNDLEPYSYDILNEDVFRFDWRPMIREMEQDSVSGAAPGLAAARFLLTLIFMACKMCCLLKEKTGLNKVVLSGGTFQNMLLLSNLPENLRQFGFDVYCHRFVSCNDEGLALGQAVMALESNL